MHMRCALALSMLVLAAAARAQGPGFPNVPRTKGELLAGPFATSMGRSAVLVWQQGLLVANPESPGSAPGSDYQTRSFDLSDPAHPVETIVPGIGPNSAIAAHGYWHEGAVLRGLGDDHHVADPDGDGIHTLVPDTSLPGFFYPNTPADPVPWVGRGLMFQPFQVQSWWSYGAANHEAVLFKGTQELARWDHIGMTGVIGHPFLLGNILYVASDQSNTGIAAYDIAPSLAAPGTPPRLIGLLNADVGGYWPEIWGGAGKLLILFPAREGGRFLVADVTDPTDMRVIADRQLPGGDPSYAQFQDHYAFMDRYKIDMRDDFAVDLALDDVAHQIDSSQFALPIGNLVVTGGYEKTYPSVVHQGLAIWAHQAEPDTTGPSVGWHVPRDEQTRYPVGAPVTLLVHETLRTETIVNGTTFRVRPLAPDGTPGAPLAGRIAFAFDDVLTFTPTAPFAPDTTYEVSLPAGGILDAAGNGMQAYSFRFSTGSSLGDGNEAPVIASFEVSQRPAPPGGEVTLSFGATDPEGAAVAYRVDFGDGTSTAWITNGSAAHAWSAPGHYDVVLLARDAAGATRSQRLTVTVMAPPAAPRPTQSAPVAFDAARGVLWSVNRDNDSLARVAANGAVAEIPLGAAARPRSVAVDAAGNAWVACEGRDEIAVLGPSGAPLAGIALEYGSAPSGLAITADGASALVTLYGRGELRRYATATRTQTGALALGPTPRAIAITGDGTRALVARFVSPETRGEVWDVALGAGLSLTRTIALAEDVTSPDTARSGRGLPNYLAGIAIDPFGRRAWVAAKQDDVRRGVFASGVELTSESTVRAIVGEIDLATGSEVFAARRDVDNSDSPIGVTFSPLGDWAFVTLQGNDTVAVYDALVDAAALGGNVPVVARFASGRAPQGAALDAAGERLYVHDFLSRGVTRFDLAAFLSGASGNVATSFVPTIASEALAPAVLAGKRIFYGASDAGGPNGTNRMSAEGYLSCATCHVDGGHDGRTWDFTGRGEGLRNTTDLRGRRGDGHGRVHWSANFDEIQDFEHDIRNAFGGVGFLDDGQFAATSDPLGAPKAGRSADLDALAAYVASLGAATLPRSPARNADGTRTAAATRGAAIFAELGCAACHAGVVLTDSRLDAVHLHDVGTLSTSSGQRLGAPLPGIDTPTLLGVAHTAPYLHDGSAASLEDVFTRAGATVLQAEEATLVGAALAHGPDYGGFYHAGRVARATGPGDRIRFSNVDGGTGGAARLTVRASALYGSQPLDVWVNGTRHGLTVALTANDPGWWPTAFRDVALDVTLAAGAGNTIELASASDVVAVDEVRVVNASDMAAIEPHGRAQTLATSERADLLAFLRELDGSDDPTPVPEPGALLASLAALAAVALRRLGARPTSRR